MRHLASLGKRAITLYLSPVTVWLVGCHESLLMTSLDPIQESWPEDDLQHLEGCPICGSSKRRLLHQGVRDWAFGSAPGAWTFWRCLACQIAFLSPRPSMESISRAYIQYYTHDLHKGGRLRSRLKTRWKNERLSSLFQKSIEPRLGLPRIFSSMVAKRAERMSLPFGWRELADLCPGRLMDVGCGDGKTMALARQLGWQAFGLEMDGSAVAAARSRNLEVMQDDFYRLRDFPGQFDVIICSHVIEHVYSPRELIDLAWAALRSGGKLLLSTPNVDSDIHQVFKKYWRGLEAPRHLVLFNQSKLYGLLEQAGFSVEARCDDQLETLRDSMRIFRRQSQFNRGANPVVTPLRQPLARTEMGQDFIKVIASKP